MSSREITDAEQAPRVLVDFPTEPLDWTRVFGDSRPIELEVGSGKGLFLLNAAARFGDRNFLGVEIARKYAMKAADRIAKRKLNNARMIIGDARRLLNQFIPSQTLSAVHIYFPDPWWKKRHKKRRVFCDAFVSDVARALKPGGGLHFATDVEEYFGVMHSLMNQHSEFERQPPPEPSVPEHDLDYLTNFERKYRHEGRPIFRAHYRLTS